MRISDWSSDVCSADLAERERLSSGGAIAPFVSTKGWQRMRNDGNGPQAFAITPQRPLRSCRWRVTEAGIEQADAHFSFPSENNGGVGASSARRCICTAHLLRGIACSRLLGRRNRSSFAGADGHTRLPHEAPGRLAWLFGK